MASYKLSDSEKVIHWKEIIIANLKSKDRQQMTAQDFLDIYPHAEISILQTAITQLITEGKVKAAP